MSDNILINQLPTHLPEGLSFEKLRGSSWVADFLEVDELKEQVKTQAYLQVQRFLTALKEV